MSSYNEDVEMKDVDEEEEVLAELAPDDESDEEGEMQLRFFCNVAQ